MKLILTVYPNRGYSAEQVEGVSLADMAQMIADAIEEYGEDAELVTFDASNGRGASYGCINEYAAIGEADE